MTREEAIKVLTHELCDWERDCKSYHVMKDALRMAIEALKREDKMLKEIERVVLYGERSEE